MAEVVRRIYDQMVTLNGGGNGVCFYWWNVSILCGDARSDNIVPVDAYGVVARLGPKLCLI